MEKPVVINVPFTKDTPEVREALTLLAQKASVGTIAKLLPFLRKSTPDVVDKKLNTATKFI